MSSNKDYEERLKAEMDELRSTRVSLEAINSLTKGILKDVKTSVSNQHAIGADIKGIQSIVNRIPK